MKTYMKPVMKKASGGIMSIIENDEDSYEDRSPENMEILSNNLRGDIRSMDDRYAELAQMVGEEQAAQTPPEVVALFQTKLAPQQPMPPVPAAKANGIAGLVGAEEQPPMPGQPPMGGPQPPMPGQPPMPPGPPPTPPGPPPTPTGQPPVQRQLGSGPSGEKGDPGDLYGGNFRINVTGVGDERPNDELQRENIAPVTQIPEVIPQTPTMVKQMPIGGSLGSPGGLLPELQSADSFIEGYQSQGGDIPTLLDFMGQPEPQFQESRDVIADYLNSIANDPMMSEAPRPVAPPQGIESLGRDTSSLSPADIGTIDDVAAGFTALQPETISPVQPIPELQGDALGYQKLAASPMPPQATQAAAQQNQKKENVSSSFSGAGLGKLLAGLGAAFGGNKKDKRDPIDQYLRMMAFASPRTMTDESPDTYLDMFGKMPGEPEKISAFDNIPNVTAARSASKPSNVEVFPVKSPGISVRPLEPQPVQRQRGSSPMGERVEPVMRITDVINQERSPAKGTPKFVQQLQAEGVIPTTPDNTPKSRPLTPAELAERVAAGERRTMSPATRTLYEMARQKGIDPVILTKRINDMSNFMKKIPGVGKLFKSIEAFESLSRGKKAAATVGGAGASFAAGLALRPNDGVVPPIPPSQFGVEQIPTEFDTAAKPEEPVPPVPPAPPPTSPTSPRDPSAIGGPIDLKPLTRETIGPVEEVTPVDTFEYDENILKEQQAAEQYAPGAERDTSGPALEKEEEDAYAKAIRKRAKVYQDLLGDSKEDRQMKAYLLLAEAGLKMMTGKGRSTAGIIAQGLQGLPSGMGKIAEQSSAIKRAAISAAISDVNAQELAKQKAAASITTALIRANQSGKSTQDKLAAYNNFLELYNIPEQQRGQLAQFLVQGVVKGDDRGNLRGPGGEIVPGGYGPANQPISEGEIGFIPPTNPFIMKDAPRPTPVVDPKQMDEIDKRVFNLQKGLIAIQAAKKELGEVIGPMNLITRGITSVTQPILGDLGPFSATKASRPNVIDAANRYIQQIRALNPERVSVFEQKENKRLEIDKNSFFNSPSIELAKVLRFETEMLNEINMLKYRLNPTSDYRQMRVPNLGTKDDPLQTEAFSALGEYFQVQPNAKVYWTDQNGKVHALTKEQFQSGMKTK